MGAYKVRGDGAGREDAGRRRRGRSSGHHRARHRRPRPSPLLPRRSTPRSPSPLPRAVRFGALEEEAVRCAALPAAHADLGVPSARLARAPDGPQPPRQGSPPGLQGQAGLRHLPRPRPPRWPQEARLQGAQEAATTRGARRHWSGTAEGRPGRLHGRGAPPVRCALPRRDPSAADARPGRSGCGRRPRRDRRALEGPRGCGGSPAAGRRAEGRRRPAPRGRRGGGDAGEHGERATGTRRRRRRAPEAGPCPCPPTFGGGAKAGKARGRGRSALEGPPTPCVGGAERASSAVATRGSRVRRRFWAASRVAGPPAFGRADGSGPSETALRAAPRSLSGSVRGETERRLCPGRRSVGARRRGAPGRDPAGRERRRARRPSRSGGFGAGRLGEGGCRLLSSRSSPRWLARSLFFPIVLSLALFFSARPLPPPVLFCFLFSLSSLRLRFPTSAFPLFFLSSPFCRESSTASR